MASAYILINCEIGEESSVMSQLKEMPNVVEVHIVYGSL